MPSQTCGLDAPIRNDTRDGVVKWGVLMIAAQDCTVLYLLYLLHIAPDATLPLASTPLTCVSLTLISVLLNLPRNRRSRLTCG